jgi:outer membrane biosynthesis protein TonB
LEIRSGLLKRKIALSCIALLACVTLLAGCLPGEPTAPEVTADTTTTKPAPPPAPAKEPTEPDTTKEPPAPVPPDSTATPSPQEPPKEPASPAVADGQPASANSTVETPVDIDSLEVPRISIDELKSKMDAGANIAVLDSRSRAAYDKVHISGALSLPLSDMTAPYPELEGYDEIIIYCT